MPGMIWEREREPFLDDKWFFYLTLFLTLFAISVSFGLIPRNHPLKSTSKAAAPPTAGAWLAINNPTLPSGGR